jgi:hypothetical protein
LQGAKDVSDELKDEDQLLGAQQKGKEQEKQHQDHDAPQQGDASRAHAQVEQDA